MRDLRLFPPGPTWQRLRVRWFPVAAAGLALQAVWTLLRADPVLEWNGAMLDAIRVYNSGPTLSTRNLAILNGAMYDAVNSVGRTHLPYRRWHDVPGPVSAEAAAVAAGHEVMRVLYPGFQARTEEVRARLGQSLTADLSTTNGLALGRTAAVFLLEERAGDGANTQIPYIPSADPGQWRRTGPFFRPPLDPHWRSVRLFCLPEKEPYVVPPPPPLDSPQYAAALEEVRAIGAVDSTVRTAHESETAVFWSDFSYTAMPPGHWHEIAADLIRERGGNLADNARLFALLGLAQADAAIVTWEGKYRYNFWRPVTAIRRADEDRNPGTVADPAWDSWLAAPPFPDHPSGHSTFIKAAATVLALFHGTDRMTFSARSDSLPRVVRRYDSFAACADEVGWSRILGGIHYEFSNRDGKWSGDRIARHVVAHHLLPVDTLPRVVPETRVADRIRFRVHAVPGARHVLEMSDDLILWTEATPFEGVVGGTRVEFDPAGPPCRFFRVR